MIDSEIAEISKEFTKELAKMHIQMFKDGAVMMTSLLAGFDIEEPLTKTQAKKFHKLILPLMERYFQDVVKGDLTKGEKFKTVYETTQPNELIEYILKGYMLLEEPAI